jgi:beta-glucosidase
MSFPSDFVWGAAAAAYQIEGAVRADGRGPSVWDEYCSLPGVISDGQSGEVACDHYHRYRSDISLMKEVGLAAYRLSISWPRVFPEGAGQINQPGLSFYDRLVDALLEAGITPWVTLFHWDFPLALYRRGGWLNRDSADWFADYTHAVVSRLADRVRHWMTLNEPQVFLGAGHHEGRHAPGDKLEFGLVLRAGHHALLAHGKSVQAIRAASPRRAEVGFAPVGSIALPRTRRPEDIAAARQVMFAVAVRSAWTNSWWMDPVFFGRYPEDGSTFYGKDAPEPRAGDLELISQPIDFCGLNVYSASYVRAAVDGRPELVPFPPGYPATRPGFPVTPEAMYWAPRFFWERYQKPIVITENGTASPDWVAQDGKVHDQQRIDFTARHLAALKQAIADGVKATAYFHWSILDNFEWQHGYSQRFGLVHVDYTTQRRVLKDSALWYKSVILSNGRDLSNEIAIE